ncbi:MAG: alpha/beta fold hydrolase [Pseudomonadota bacterium]
MAKPHVVFVPGLLCNELLWEHQLAHLSAVANCMVANVTQADSITGLAESALAQAPERFALCGLSMGGIIANAMMRIAPERIERLALLDTNARADLPEQTERRRLLLELSAAGRMAEVALTLLPNLVHPSRLADAPLTNAIVGMACSIGAAAFERQITALIGRPDARGALGSYDLPTLIVCGRADAITPLEMHEEMASLIPNSLLSVIEDCGHMSTMEQPQAVTALLSTWLQL